MKLHESPLLSADIIVLNCPEGTHELIANEEVHFYWDGAQWFARQRGTDRPVTTPQDPTLFEGVAGRRESICVAADRKLTQ